VLVRRIGADPVRTLQADDGFPGSPWERRPTTIGWMPGSHPIDGSLAGWNDIAAGEWSWEGALIGNGLSINVWPNFNYASLYDEAERGTKYGGLSDEDKALFAEFDTHNFEIALARSTRRSASLSDSAKTLGLPRAVSQYPGCSWGGCPDGSHRPLRSARQDARCDLRRAPATPMRLHDQL
jgi:hypothetical protein